MLISDRVKFFVDDTSFFLSRNYEGKIITSPDMGNPLHRDYPLVVVARMDLGKEMNVARMYYQPEGHNTIIIMEKEDLKNLSDDEFCKEIFRRYESFRDTLVISDAGRLFWIDGGRFAHSNFVNTFLMDEGINVKLKSKGLSFSVFVNEKEVGEVEATNSSSAYLQIVGMFLRASLEEDEILYIRSDKGLTNEAFAVKLNSDTDMRSLGPISTSFFESLVLERNNFMYDRSNASGEYERFLVYDHKFHLLSKAPFAHETQEEFRSDIIEFIFTADEKGFNVAGITAKEKAIYEATSPYIKPLETIQKAMREIKEEAREL